MPPMTQERRINDILLQYWNLKRGKRPFPAENDIDPAEIGSVWDYCFLIQTRDIENAGDYNYTYLGKEIIRAYHGGLEEEPGSPMLSPNASRLAQRFQKVFDNREPVTEEGEFINIKGMTVKFRQILLPLGHGDHIHAIFGGMRFKVFG